MSRILYNNRKCSSASLLNSYEHLAHLETLLRKVERDAFLLHILIRSEQQVFRAVVNIY